MKPILSSQGEGGLDGKQAVDAGQKAAAQAFM